MNSSNPLLEIREFAGTGELGGLMAPLTEDVQQHHEGLSRGELVLQVCQSCARARYPIAPICPYCISDEFAWSAVRGSGHVHSWVRYHKSYLPQFEPLMPYVVLTVKLACGALMFGRLLESEVPPAIGMAVVVVVERSADHYVPSFAALHSDSE
jgi:uncharacterized OB-fold protein